ncbi:hypothetical protein D5086_003819 [Populus alba]|uniref:Uncharacterized protein n=1 Tax=Populus alba TaxID=43335 RepID=A0ACC4D689_POPAL
MDLQASIVIIISFLIFAFSQAQDLQPFHQEYGPFNETYYGIFEVEEPATISNSALQITPDSINGNFTLANRSGRVMLNKSFALWEDDGVGGARVASFNSSFLINIFRLNNSIPGEGFAFLIAPDLELPENSNGQYLGLTNSTTDNNTSNGIVAIELDTVKQEFDPDDNHMGLDIHSVISRKTVPLVNLGIEIAPVGGRNHMVWVHYYGNSKRMEVYMVEEGKAKPATPALAAELNLKEHVRQKSYFGFAASTGSNFQLNCVLKWNLTVEMLSDPVANGNGRDNKKLIKICVGIGVALFSFLLIGVGSLVYYLHKKRAASDPTLLRALQSLPGMPREFPFKDLKKATNNFDEKHKLGQGGFGVVYKVVLEVVCGQRPWTKIGGFQFLVDWVWSLHREGRILEAVDERLNNDYVAEEAQRLLLLGLACSHPIANERPKTQVIFQIVSGSVPAPRVPPFKPAFVWPAYDGSIDVDASSAGTTPLTSGWTPQYISRESEGYTDSPVSPV